MAGPNESSSRCPGSAGSAANDDTPVLRVLIVEDSEDDTRITLRELRRAGLEIVSQRVETREQMLEALRSRTWDIVLSDYSMPHFDGFAAFELLEEQGYDLPFIMISATLGEELAVAAMRRGVSDYLIKGRLGRLAPAVQREIRAHTDRKQKEEEIARLRRQLELENDYLRAEIKEAGTFGNIVGSSRATREMLHELELVARTDASVLVLGESGTGKELVAHAVHERSPRAQRPLIKVNCAAVPKELFESEFFGHIKGAFSGAVRDRAGRFEMADGGTLFLDEVGELPYEMQGKLLRVLQEGAYERIGEGRTCKVDVRIVAATNRDMEREIAEGRFRQDLYYRLAVFPLRLPPLRERPDEIPALARHFIRRAATRFGTRCPELEEHHLEQLMQYDWPGNVRELQNVIERAVIIAAAREFRFDLPGAGDSRHADEVRRSPSADDQPPGEVDPAGEVLTYDDLRELERRSIQTALRLSDGKVSGAGGAAARLGIKPTTLTSRMKRLDIERRR